MSDKFVFIIHSIYELQEFEKFINFLIFKKKKIIFFYEKTKKKNFINKFIIRNLLKKNFEMKSFKSGLFPLNNINNSRFTIISTHSYSHIFGEKKYNFKFLFFQSFLDSFHMITESDLVNIDYFFFHTKYWKNILRRYFGNKVRLIEKKTFFYGYPKIKNISQKSHEIKNYYNIKTNKKILLLMYGNFNKSNSIFSSILNFSNPINQIFRFIINTFKFKKFSLRAFMLILKNISLDNFANKINEIKKNNNYYIVIKTRKKSTPQNKLLSISDKLIAENKFDPLAADKLIKISDLIIHFSSTSIISAIYFNKQNLSILKPVDETLENDKKKYFFYRSIRKKKDDLFNYKNLSKKISFEDFINPVNKISFFEKNIFKNEATYQNFIRKFIFDKSYALSFNKIYKIINKI